MTMLFSRRISTFAPMGAWSIDEWLTVRQHSMIQVSSGRLLHSPAFHARCSLLQRFWSPMLLAPLSLRYEAGRAVTASDSRASTARDDIVMRVIAAVTI